jgi:hypothetical protein
MPAVPQILKVIEFSLDGEDFSLDVIDAAVVPVPGAIQTVKTLDGVTHQDAESESWQLELRAVVDWDTVRPGLASYLFTNRGDTVPFIIAWNTAGESTTNPSLTGNCTLVPIPYGGAGNTFAEATVTLPIDGVPVPDTTP